MKTTQNTKLTRLVKTILDVVFGLLVFASIFLVLSIAISPLLQKDSDSIVISASVPVAIGTGDDPQLGVQVTGPRAPEISYAFVKDAQGTLFLETRSWDFTAVSNAGKLITAIGLAYVVYLLRLVVQAILQGETFTEKNTERIRRIGYLVLLIGFLRPMVEYLAAKWFMKQLAIMEPALSLPTPFKAEVILGSLLILVLAQVWSHGLELEREQTFTI